MVMTPARLQASTCRAISLATRGMTKVSLQRFSKTVIGPIFFEFIDGKGDEGFGECNFRALFESIEEDQIWRRVLKTLLYSEAIQFAGITVAVTPNSCSFTPLLHTLRTRRLVTY